MRFHRPARRIALWLGAAGIALGSGGLAIAATALIQPAGALSVQVPAVAVREQNVNAAGRIRVALPKGGVGVNGSVSVNNFPKTQPVSGTVNVGNLPTTSTSHEASAGGLAIGSTPVTLVSAAGPGVLKGFILSVPSPNGGQVAPIVTIDGHTVWADGVCAPACWNSATYGSPSVSGIQNFQLPNGGAAVEFFPPGGLPFQNSLVIQAVTYAGSANSGALFRALYTTAG